jgi:hypothetical protein
LRRKLSKQKLLAKKSGFSWGECDAGRREILQKKGSYLRVFFFAKKCKKMHFSWKKGVFLRFFAEFLPKMTKKSWFFVIFFFSSGGYANEKTRLKEYRPRGKNPPIYTVLNAAFSAPCGAPWWTPPHSPAKAPFSGRPAALGSFLPTPKNTHVFFPAKIFFCKKIFLFFRDDFSS